MTWLVWGGVGIRVGLFIIEELVNTKISADERFVWYLGLLTRAMDTVASWTCFLVTVRAGYPQVAGSAGTLGLVHGLLLWLHTSGGGPGKRRRAPRQIGEKARARIRALVKQMTPSPVRSPAAG